MEKVIEETFKIFSHLARDIQTYVIAGFILLFDFYIIDKTYYSESFSRQIFCSNYFILIIIVASYILGQICLAFYTFIFEIKMIDKWFYNNFFVNRFTSSLTETTDENMMADKGKIFKSNKELYFHFIERDVNLSTLRWNYSSAFLICSIINILYCIFENYEKEILIIAGVSIFISWILLLLHIFTQKETAYQVSKLKDESIPVLTITESTTTTTVTTTTTNSTYKKLAVQWFNEALYFVSSLVLPDSLVLRNRQLLVAAKR